MEHYIFGGPNGRKWDEKDWTASDDRVRGGKSVSRITVDTETGKTAAKFSGNLDITALGGAGFASQRTTIFEGDEPLNLKGYDALVLNITAPGDPCDGEGEGKGESESEKPVKKYTVTLKDTILPKRLDGREQSTVSWEADFVLGKGETEITLLFEDFKPTYRGKPVEDGSVRLDWGGIKRVSLMVRSFFGDQYGPFSLVISSIAARKTVEEGKGWGCCVL